MRGVHYLSLLNYYNYFFDAVVSSCAVIARNVYLNCAAQQRVESYVMKSTIAAIFKCASALKDL